MLNTLLLDCADSLREKLVHEGFSVEAGTVGMCTGFRRLPSQVYEKEIFFYNPEQVNLSRPLGTLAYQDLTPQFSLSNLEARIKNGATFVAFLNPIVEEIAQLNNLYKWIPFMPPLEFSHDKVVIPNDFDSWQADNFKQLEPLVCTEELQIPIAVKLIPPQCNPRLHLPDVLPLFFNGNGDCLGVGIMRGNGRLILLPRFQSNSDVIETFLHRVMPKLYELASRRTLIDRFITPVQQRADSELAALASMEDEVRERQGKARTALNAARREKENVINADPTARQVLVYHDNAQRHDDVALYYLYKVLEAIENKFGGEAEAIRLIGAGAQWKAVKRLANESYRDARHAPKPTDVVKKWTQAEIKQCFENTDAVVMAYFESLFPKESGTPTE
jgi:hypothetical protein